jgi:nicotinamide-nucleotide amidase
MSELETELSELLSSLNMTLATAESCTGGLIANRITNVSGSSRYFERGVITYSNESKIDLLDVPLETIERYGAVSSETAVAMANGVRNLAKTDLGLAVTGIAGPDGGTPEKPVGLVFIALARNDYTECKKLQFDGSRTEIKEKTANAALEIVIGFLRKNSD